MTQPLILYGMNSPNVRKVVIMLEELGLPYELRHVAVIKGEQFKPSFLAMNPLAKVPVLVDPLLDHPLAESGAILFWLAERAPSSGAFLPATGPARYEVMQWLMIQMASIGPMFGQFNHYRIMPAGTHPYSFARYRAQAQRLYRLLDDRLGGEEWIAGGAYSIADIATYPWAIYLERHEFDPADYPALLRWRDTIAARPTVKRAEQSADDAFTAPSMQVIRTATTDDLDRFFGREKHMPAADFSSILGLGKA